MAVTPTWNTKTNGSSQSPEEMNQLAQAVISNAGELNDKANTSDVVPNTRTVSGKPLNADIVITKGDIGLSSVDNTADLNKPISTDVQTALNGKVPTSRMVNGKDLSTDIVISKSDVGLGSVDNTSDLNKPISTLTQTSLDGKVPISRSVNGKQLSGDISLNKSDVGLANVDNTSDTNKPISTLTQTALDAKVPITRSVNSKALNADITLNKSDIGLPNVDNTSDANKPISTATQTALSGKVDTSRAVNGHALTADVTVTKTDIGLSNVPNVDTTNPSNITQDATHRFFTDTERTTLAGLSGFNPTAYANSKFFETANGMYYPILTAAGLDNPSANATNGLVNNVNGGVSAAVSGTSGVGNIYLPIPIDPTKAFRVSILVEINDSQPMSIYFRNATGDFQTGVIFTNISTGSLSVNIGASTVINQYGFTGGIPAGTKIWLTIASDGTNGAYVSVIPDVTPSGFNFSAPAFQVAFNSGAYSVFSSLTTASSGFNVWGGSGAQLKNRLCRLNIDNKSTASRVIGAWINQGLGGPSDGRLQPPAVLRTNILQDATAIVLIPKKTGYAPVDLVMLMHQNAYGTQNFFSGGTAPGIALGKVFAAGYLCFGLDGVYGDTTAQGTEATQSNWGAPTGMKYRKAFWQWIRDNIPGTRNIFEWGLSMGFLNSLRLSIQYPNQIRGIVGVGGVCDLTDCINNRGFASTVNKAYGTWFVATASVIGITPNQVVNISTAATTGATSLSVSALTNSIPSGTTLTFLSGTGPTTVVTTALANASATSIAVSAISADIALNTKFNMTAYWFQISYGFGQPDEVYYKSPYVWRDSYANATSYSTNDIVTISNSTGTAKTYAFVDPNLNPYEFLNIPMAIWHGDADTLIPIAQAQNFRTAVNAIGGNVVLNTVAGGTHLGDSTFDGDGIVTWLNSKA